MTLSQPHPSAFMPLPPPPTAEHGVPPMGRVGILGCAAGVAGSFMAWITVTSGFGAIDLKGTSGDGKITAVIGIVAGLLALVGFTQGKRGHVVLAAVVALGGAGMSFFEWRHVTSSIDSLGSNEFARASVGNGIWVMLAGFTVAAVCLFKSAPADVLDAYTTPVQLPRRDESTEV